MKNSNQNIKVLFFGKKLLAVLLMLATSFSLQAQDSASSAKPESKPVKNTFGAIWLIDNQTVEVPIKGTFMFEIQHRFGTVDNGSEDLWGVFAPSNIRLGLDYVPINKLNLGIGLTKENMVLDLNAKYALLQQTKDNRMPVSLVYFGNIAFNLSDESNFNYDVHRISYFNTLMLARKFTDAFSVQVSPSFSWFNNVEGYVDSEGEVQGKMNNGHFAISFLGRYKVTDKTSIIAGWDQPLTEHTTNNPHPNICFGVEFQTSSHAFQVFAGNYYSIVPQYNHMYNKNDYRDGQFLIGFNMNRLWNF